MKTQLVCILLLESRNEGNLEMDAVVFHNFETKELLEYY
jgi:hypothetical protein